MKIILVTGKAFSPLKNIHYKTNKPKNQYFHTGYTLFLIQKNFVKRFLSIKI